MAARCIRAALRNETMTLDRLRPREPKPVQEKLGKPVRRRHSRDRYFGETAEFTEQVGGLLPWHQLAAEARLGRVKPGDIDGRIAVAKAASATAGPRSYDEDRPIQDEIAMLWAGVALGAPDPRLRLERFEEWRQGLTKPLFIPTLIATARRAGRTADCGKCLIPDFDGALSAQAWKDALWDRFYTGAPARQRHSVERYNIVKRA